jgi:type VI secretion system protein ImpI
MAELVLTLEGGGPPEVRRLQGGRFSIGRAADNDWVLPDPERFLSKHHCILEERSGEWRLTDTSSNGVFVGDAPSPLGAGRSVRLEDGLRLRLGSYALTVRLTGGAAAAMPDEPRRRDNGSELFDTSWFRGRSLEAPAHPLRVEQGTPFTRPDHAPADELALDLPRRPSPFAELPARTALPPSEAPEQPAAASPLLDPDWQRPGPMTAPSAEPPRPVPNPEPAPPVAELFSPPAPAPAPAPAPVAAPAATGGATGADAQRCLAAFLDGAGLQPADIGDADPLALLEDLGRRYRLLAGGLVELLMLRAALKRETGLDRTMIAASGNNPLKLTATAEEAVRWLVTARGAGYLPPDPAIAGALDDLKSFMPELVRAMQQALRNLLRRFEPGELERALADASLLEILAAGGRKAKYWELFKERYAELAREAESAFLREVGIDIDRARRGPTLEEKR